MSRAVASCMTARGQKRLGVSCSRSHWPQQQQAFVVPAAAGSRTPGCPAFLSVPYSAEPRWRSPASCPAQIPDSRGRQRLLTTAILPGRVRAAYDDRIHAFGGAELVIALALQDVRTGLGEGAVVADSGAGDVRRRRPSLSMRMSGVRALHLSPAAPPRPIDGDRVVAEAIVRQVVVPMIDAIVSPDVRRNPNAAMPSAGGSLLEDASSNSDIAGARLRRTPALREQ